MSKFNTSCCSMLCGSVLCLACATNAFATTLQTTGDADVVMTMQGAVRGSVNAAYREFLGLPYAAPPVGRLRWRAPQPPASWQGIRDASAFGNRCPQFASPILNDGSMNEDCLYLNVYTPAVIDRPLPVMVWLHGGTYLLGAGSDYDGSVLAAHHQVIVVTINYRIGPFGFLALSGLRSAAGSSGNSGLEDQQAALRWVQSNIAAFGGDPGNVTLFGESAGAASVCSQMVSPAAASLFHKAIMESAPCATVFVTKPQAFAEHFGREYAARPGLACEGSDQAIARCMRGKSTQQIMAAMNIAERNAVELTFLPVIDGVILPSSPPKAFRIGDFNRVPVISGTNHDEGRLLIAIAADDGQPQIALTNDLYARGAVAVTEQTLPGLNRLPAVTVPLALPLYPLRDFPAPAGYDPDIAPAHLAMSALMTDAVFACAGSVSNRALDEAGVPIYAYEFGDPGLANQIDSPYMPIAAGHTSELPFVFQTPLEGGNVNTVGQFTASQFALSDQMQTYWTNFAASGDPNLNPDASAAQLPHWPLYAERDGAQRLQFAPGEGGVRVLEGQAFSRDHRCAFWAPLMSGYAALM